MKKITKEEKMEEIARNIRKPIMATSLIAGSLLTILIAGHVHIKWNTNQNQEKMDSITKELETLQQDINTAQSQQEEYKKELDLLESRLAMYQDIVIPDSMK